MRSISQIIRESSSIGIPVLDRIESSGKTESNAKKIFGDRLEPFMGYVIKYKDELKWVSWDFNTSWKITDKSVISTFDAIKEDDMIPVTLKPVRMH